MMLEQLGVVSLFNSQSYDNCYVCLVADIEVNPGRSGLAAAQEEQTEAVSSTHSEADEDDDEYPEPPRKIFRPSRPVSPPAPRIEECRSVRDIDDLLVLKSNVCCKYSRRTLSIGLISVQLQFLSI